MQYSALYELAVPDVRFESGARVRIRVVSNETTQNLAVVFPFFF